MCSPVGNPVHVDQAPFPDHSCFLSVRIQYIEQFQLLSVQNSLTQPVSLVSQFQ